MSVNMRFHTLIRPMIGVTLVFMVSACDPAPRSEPLSVRERLAQGAGHSPQGGPAKPGVTSMPVDPREAIALINDQPVDRRLFTQTLVEARGLTLLQQMILLEVVRQEAARRGLSLSAKDIEHEYDLTLQGAQFDGKDVEKLTPARRELLIEDWTQSRGVMREELSIAIRRQAYLRKMVEGGITIDEEMLRKEFARAHGEKVEVRHIQVPALRVCEQVRQRLAQGDRFEDLVMDYSQNALSREKRGLLPLFTADDPTVPPEFARAAFALQVGEVSNPIEKEGSFHILRLERRVPADTVSYQECEEALRRNLTARLAVERMNQLGEDLLMRARFKIEDRSLREQYTKLRTAQKIVGPPLAD